MDPDAVWGDEWVDRGMGVLDEGGDRRRRRGSFGVNLGCPVVTNGDSDALFTNYFAGGLVTCFMC